MTQTYETPPAARPHQGGRADEPTLESTARLAAAAVRAPVGIVCLAEPFVAIVSGPQGGTSIGPPSGSPGMYHLLSWLLGSGAGFVAIEDFRSMAPSAGLYLGDLGGLESFAGVPLLNEVGEIRGLVGAFDTIPRSWSTGDHVLLASLGELAHPTAKPFPHRADGLVRVADQFSGVFSAAAADLRGLVAHAASYDDPVLRRRAGVAERHLDDLGTEAGRLRAEFASAGQRSPAVAILDLRPVVESAAREAVMLAGSSAFHLELPPRPIPVAGARATLQAALERLFTMALVVAPAETVRAELHGVMADPDSLKGSLAAELVLTVREVAVPVGDLTRAVGGLLEPDCGILARAGRVRVGQSPREVHIEASGLSARSTVVGTQVRVRWPVDLG